MSYQLTKDATEIKLGNVDACELHGKVNVEGQEFTHRMIAVLRSDHVLVITLASDTPAAAETLDQIVRSVKFD